MKKEIPIAIFLGVFVGLGATFGIVKLFHMQTANTKTPVTQQAAQQTNQQSAPQTSDITPNKSMSWDNSKLVIAGTKQSDSFLFLVSSKEDLPILTKDQTFSTEVTPASGKSTYKLFNQKGVMLSSFDVLSFANLKKEQTLLLGSVTDLSQEGVQVRGEDGTIEEVSYAKEAVFVTATKDIKIIDKAEIAIGDKIAVAYEIAERGMLLAHGIFVLPAEAAQNMTLFAGPLTQYTKTQVTVKTEKEEKQLQVNAQTKFFGIKSDGQTRKRTRLIDEDLNQVLFITASDSATARSIFISE